MTETKIQPLRHRTKTQAITVQLTEVAKQLGPEARMPTIQQLCVQLGVSVVTLNRSLSELEASNIIVRKHGVGIFVSTRLNQRTIGLVYDRDIFAPGASPFCGQLVEAARGRAANDHEQFSFYLAVPSNSGLPVHDDLVEDLRSRRLEGLIFVGESNPQAVDYLQNQDIPMVALSYTSLAPYRVCIDWCQTVKLGVQALAEKGCRNIALWIPLGTGLGKGKSPEIEAFCSALKSHRLAFREENIWRSDVLSGKESAPDFGANQEQGFRAVHEVFSTPEKSIESPDGLVILDDLMARGAIMALQQNGLTIGKDVQIAAHLNKGSQVLESFRNTISTIEIDPQEIVDALFVLLEKLMDGKKVDKKVVAIRPRLKA